MRTFAATVTASRGAPALRRLLATLPGADVAGGAVPRAECVGGFVRLVDLPATGGPRLLIHRLLPDRAHAVELVTGRWLPAGGVDDLAPRLRGVAAERWGGTTWHVWEEPAGDRYRPADPRHAAALARGLARLHAGLHRNLLLEECRAYCGERGTSHAIATTVRDALARLETAGAEPVPPGAAARRDLVGNLQRLLAESARWNAALQRFGCSETLLQGGDGPIFVTARGGTVFLDWRRAAVGPAAEDLAVFLARLPAAARPAALEVYSASRAAAGCALPREPDLDALLDTVMLIRSAHRLAGKGWPAETARSAPGPLPAR